MKTEIEIDQYLEKAEKRLDLFEHFIRNYFLIKKEPHKDLTTPLKLSSIPIKDLTGAKDPEFVIRINGTELGKLHHILGILETILDKSEEIQPDDRAHISELGLRLVHDWKEILDSRVKLK